MDKLSDPFNLAWCVGLFEGEGSLFIANQVRKERNGATYSYARAVLKTTDLDVLSRFHFLVDCGTVIEQTDRCRKLAPPNWKKHWYWQLTKREELKKLMFLFYPHLGNRRQHKVREIFPDVVQLAGDTGLKIPSV